MTTMWVQIDRDDGSRTYKGPYSYKEQRDQAFRERDAWRADFPSYRVRLMDEQFVRDDEAEWERVTSAGIQYKPDNHFQRQEQEEPCVDSPRPSSPQSQEVTEMTVSDDILATEIESLRSELTTAERDRQEHIENLIRREAEAWAENDPDGGWCFDGLVNHIRNLLQPYEVPEVYKRVEDLCFPMKTVTVTVQYRCQDQSPTEHITDGEVLDMLACSMEVDSDKLTIVHVDQDWA